VEHYLEHEDERLEIARAGWRRAQQHAPGPRLHGLMARLERLRSSGRTRDLTRMTPAAGAAAAMQALALADGTPWGAVEQTMERAEDEGLRDAAAHVNRAVLYYGYAAESPPDAASQAASWANEQLTRALDLEPEDGVAMLNRIELARALGAGDAVRAAARELATLVESGCAHASPGRLVLPLQITRLRLAWQAALLAGSAVEPRLTELVLGEAYRLAAETEEDAAEQAALYGRSLACLATPEGRQARAVALLRAGDAAAALAELETLLEECPLWPSAWFAYAGLLVAAGRRPEAAEFVDRCELLAARIDFVDEEIARRLREELFALASSR
jgi:tetratricopeptide (TPR) repeat protein